MKKLRFDERGQTAWFLEGVKQAMGGPAYVVAIALLGVGGLARAAEFPAGVAFLSTLLIWAGPAQLLFFGAVAAKTALPAVALTVSLSSIRLAPMCLSILPMLKTPKTRTPALLFAAHFIAITIWAESLNRLPAIEKKDRLPFFYGFSIACSLTTALFTVVGYFMAAVLPTPLATAILFLSPVYFMATVTRGARAPIDWFAIFFGLTLAPLTQKYVGGGFDLLILGIFGGGCAYGAARCYERYFRRRA